MSKFIERYAGKPHPGYRLHKDPIRAICGHLTHATHPRTGRCSVCTVRAMPRIQDLPRCRYCGETFGGEGDYCSLRCRHSAKIDTAPDQATIAARAAEIREQRLAQSQREAL